MGPVVSGITGIAEPEHPEITVPWPHWPRLPGVRSHQSSRLPADHCTLCHGVPVTTVARTLVDLSKVLEARFLAWVVEGCLRRGPASLAALHAAHQWLAKPARHGLAAVGEVLARRPEGFDPGGSGAELDLSETLVEAGLAWPVQQHQVRAGGTVYSLDYAIPSFGSGSSTTGGRSTGCRPTSIERPHGATRSGWPAGRCCTSRAGRIRARSCGTSKRPVW